MASAFHIVSHSERTTSSWPPSRKTATTRTLTPYPSCRYVPIEPCSGSSALFLLNGHDGELQQLTGERSSVERSGHPVYP